MPKVLIAPAPLKEIEPVFGPILRDAGLELIYPLRNAQMTEDELLAQLPGCVASLAGSEPYTPRVLAAAAAQGLKIIARAGVGYDGVHVEAATQHGVAVAIAPGTNQDSVAEHTFMLILALARNLIPQHTQTMAGQWSRRVNQPIRGRTLGVLGFGRIGKTIALRGLNFGMSVVVHDPFADVAFAQQHNIPLLSADDVIRQADYLTLHMPMTPESKHLICQRTIELMKPTAFLINTARGGVIHEPDLVAALKANRIAGAGLDVFDEEPPVNSPLLTLDNVVVTPHTAGVDLQSRDDMARVAAQAIVRVLHGDWPDGWIVNPIARQVAALASQIA